jgi:hypothetical protein
MSKNPVVNDDDECITDGNAKIIADHNAELLDRNKKLIAASNNYAGMHSYSHVRITVPNKGIQTTKSKGRSAEYFCTEIAGKPFRFARRKIVFESSIDENPVTIRLTWAEFAYRELREFSRIKIMAPADMSDENKNPLYSREAIFFKGR